MPAAKHQKIEQLPRSNDIDVADVSTDTAFAARSHRPQNLALQMEGMQRIARAFIQGPEAVLQELVDTAVKLCDADSAVISVEQENGTEAAFYRWIATSGEYSKLRNITLPRTPSPCTVALQRGTPQIFQIHSSFFEQLGIDARGVTDGILLPWQIVNMRGTIFIMAHDRPAAFNYSDLRTMQLLAEFASIGIELLRKQKLLVEQARIAGAAQMANHLAHAINNPLQSLTNILYLAANGQHGIAARTIGQQGLAEVATLSKLVSKLLSNPTRKMRCSSRFNPQNVKLITEGPRFFGNFG